MMGVIHKTNGRCFYCNRAGEVIDHFISKKKWREWGLDDTPMKGTLDDADNLFMACDKCNRKKSTKCPEDFIGNEFICWDRYKRANRRITK